MSSTKTEKIRAFLLPLILFIIWGSWFGLYYESNDDFAIDLMLRGITTVKPVNNFHLYMYGWSQILAFLYTYLPQIPWYGLLLYLLLYFANVLLLFCIEFICRNKISGKYIVMIDVLVMHLFTCVLFFKINFSKPALLLSGIILVWLLVRYIYDAKNINKKDLALTLVIFVAAWALRPGAAILGLITAAPLIVFVPFSIAVKRVMIPFVLLIGLLQMGVMFSFTSEGELYRKIDIDKAKLIDYHVYKLNEKPDNKNIDIFNETLVKYYGFNDEKVFSADFFSKNYVIDYTGLIQREGISKVKRVFYDVIRQFFPFFIIIFIMLFFMNVNKAKSDKSWFGVSKFMVIILYQIFYVIFLLLLALFTHMPPRIMQPMAILYLICTFIMCVEFMPNITNCKQIFMRYKILAFSLIAIGFVSQTKLISGLLLESNLDQKNKEKYLYYLSEKYKGKLLVEGGLSYSNLNPLRSYGFYNYSKVYSLTGWPAFDPSQRVFRRYLTGYSDFGPAMKRLAQRPDAVWILMPDLEKFLKIYFSARNTDSGWNIKFKELPDNQNPYVHEYQASLVNY